MGWFVYALLTVLAWGTADLFYKKGAAVNEKFSHLKTSILVGCVMGAHAIFTLISGDINYNPVNLLVYLPVSSMYILSMTIGYFGLRYLEVSICSPVQNSSGALVCLLCLIFLGDRLSPAPAVAVAVICLGIFALGVLEKKSQPEEIGDGKYKTGIKAFAMPILYCIFDALGTFFDAWYLDDISKTPLRDVTSDTLEAVANTSYELTFLLCAIVLFIYVRFVKKEPIKPKMQGNRLCAAILETAGQFTYVYAMSGEAVAAAPMVASYSIVSILLSRIFLKEKLSFKQYIAVFAVMAGICVLGIFDL